jgi:hypothetical protein
MRGERTVHPASWAEGLTAVGFLAAFLALIRMRDDEFDLPPLCAASG